MNIPSRLNFESYKDGLIRLVLWMLLIGSLVATITNLAWAFSVVSPSGSNAAWFGAISFDGSVLIISFYARRFDAGSYPRRLARAIVITNTVISIYANVFRSIEFQRELERISGAAWASMPIVAGFALPLLTWGLAEILVLDETKRTSEFEREQKRAAKQTSKTRLDIQPDKTGQKAGQIGLEAGPELGRVGRINRADRLELVVEAVGQGKRSRADIVEYTGIPKGSVNSLISELYSQNRLVKNQTDQPELPNQTES